MYLRSLQEHLNWSKTFSDAHSYTDLELKKQYTDKKFLIAEQARMVEDLRRNPYKHHFDSPEESCIGSYTQVDLHPQNRVSLNNFMTIANLRYEGKFFVCRTITHSIKVCSVLVLVEVPDAGMEDRGAFLSLYNYEYPEEGREENSVPVLSPGTILAVKNPMFYRSSATYSVRCDSPVDVVVLDEKQFEKLFHGLKWPSGYLNNGEKCLLLKKTWRKKIVDWKSIGRLRLNRKNYIGAIQAFTSAIKFNPRDIEALTYRCALHLRFEVYKKSIIDADAILSENPFHEDAICFRATSLIGLSQYKAAIEFLKMHLADGTLHIVDSTQKYKLMQLLRKANVWRNQERYGAYNIVEMLKCPLGDGPDCADYIGSVIKVYIHGKGYGMLAKTNIKCGDLIVANKAYAIAYPENLDEIQKWIYMPKLDEFRSHTQMKLNAMIAHRLMLNPEIGKEFYTLYDGNERTLSQSIRDDVAYKFVDMKRIDAICDFNSFCGDSLYDDYLEFVDNTPMGVWPVTSLFNHSCFDANSRWTITGDVMLIRACKDIIEFEEITVPYICCSTEYSERSDILSRFGFVCDCSLCLLDTQENYAVISRRRDILQEFKNLKQAVNVQCSQIETLIKELESLRPDHPKLNVYLVHPLMKLLRMYIKEEKYELAANTALKIHAISFKTCMTEVSIQCCLDGIWSCLHCNKIDEAKKFITALKTNFIQEYGTFTEELLNHVSKAVAEIMTQHGMLLDTV